MIQELIYPLGPAPLIPAKMFARPGRASEMLPVVEPSGLVIGQAERSYCHNGSKVLHPVVHLHILNREGGLYIQKRSLTKDLLPGYWDTAVGGHIAYGETIAEALFREAAEELCFHDFNPVHILTYVFESDTELELVNVFAAVGNFHPEPDGDEVEEGRFWAQNEIEENLSHSIFTPNFEQEYRRISSKLYALL